MEDPKFIRSLQKKYVKVRILWQFALDQLEISEDALKSHTKADLHSLELRLTSIQSTSRESPAKLSGDLDIVIRELTKIAYPITAENNATVKRVVGLALRANYKWILFYISMITLAAVIWSYDSIQSTIYPTLWASVLAIALGTLGSLLHNLLNLKSTTPELVTISSVLLGAINGWLFYFGLIQTEFIGVISGPRIQFLVPFCAGFSTRPVLILMIKMVHTMETIIGIAD